MARDLTEASRRRARPALLAAYGVVSVADVLAQLTHHHFIVLMLPLLLMPPLAAYFAVSVPRGRVAAIMLVALSFAWLGDSIPGPPLVAIAFFVVTQAAYCLAFAPHWRRSLITRPVALIAYAVPMLTLVVVVGLHAGPLVGPVIVYGLLVTVMVALASGVSWLTWVGAALFLASDVVLSLDLFFAAADSPVRGAVIMVTYLAGQLMIVSGVIRQTRRSAGAPSQGLLVAARR